MVLVRLDVPRRLKNSRVTQLMENPKKHVEHSKNSDQEQVLLILLV